MRQKILFLILFYFVTGTTQVQASPGSPLSPNTLKEVLAADEAIKLRTDKINSLLNQQKPTEEQRGFKFPGFVIKEGDTHLRIVSDEHLYKWIARPEGYKMEVGAAGNPMLSDSGGHHFIDCDQRLLDVTGKLRPHASCWQTDVTELPFDSELFEQIVLRRFPWKKSELDLNKVFSELKRVLNPTGTVVILTSTPGNGLVSHIKMWLAKEIISAQNTGFKVQFLASPSYEGIILTIN